ncbi:hypothetical protein NDU88_011874 [Pleurodeles waltl]|uniref:Uncharacterized protein n=1 Tax=Pleurodeles waltl TaxID=8319 RepID=A0AAV7R492_PLEWA|nr:hypothetical protein NDU88_011874 [Pleurodeles waltl]
MTRYRGGNPGHMAVMLGISEEQGLSKAERDLFFVAMATARMCSAAGWVDPEAPSFAEWQARFLAMYNLEEGVYERRGRWARKKGNLNWAPVDEWLGQSLSIEYPRIELLVF